MNPPLPQASASQPAVRPGTLPPRHLYSLDALRGLAAIGVVLWHWQHFFFLGGSAPAGFARERQPLYGLFGFLYTDGWRAVDLFFCLSGFIFFWLYADRVAGGAVSFREFAVLRLSRLYPLHLATLLFCAAAQAVFLHACGQTFVYQENNLPHFLLQLGLASSWVPGSLQSFNGPVWSVSVEVLLYGAFFALCLSGWRRWWQLLPLVALGICTQGTDWGEMGRGFLSFFTGALTCQLYVVLARRGVSRRSLWKLSLVIALLWLNVQLLLQPTTLVSLYLALPLLPHPAWQGNDLAATVISSTLRYSPQLILFPLTILTLALWETGGRLPVSRLAFLGQISYSSYLLHFPLQIVWAAATRALGLPTSIYCSSWMLASFYAVLVPLSLACFRHFELPCQDWLRARLLPAPGSGQPRPAPPAGEPVPAL